MPSIPSTSCPWRVEAEQLGDIVREVLFVSVGFAVLGFQRTQVRRRELTEAITGGLGGSLGRIEDVVTAVERGVSATTRQLRHLVTQTGA